MKKLFSVIVIAAFTFAACNSGGESTETKTDTTVVTPAATDAAPVTTAPVSTDTTAAPVATDAAPSTTAK